MVSGSPPVPCLDRHPDAGYLDHVRRALGMRRRQALQPGPVPAAVLLPLFCRDGSLQLLFTKRTDRLNHHSGEICFPGGVRHGEDPDLMTTALRETWEEVGIRPEDVEVLGALDDIVSVHDYLVTPFVGVIPGSYRFTVNPEEIERLITVPVADLLRPGSYRVEDWSWKGREMPVPFFTCGEDEIWGLTASILRQFLDLTRQGSPI